MAEKMIPKHDFLQKKCKVEKNAVEVLSPFIMTMDAILHVCGSGFHIADSHCSCASSVTIITCFVMLTGCLMTCGVCVCV